MTEGGSVLHFALLGLFVFGLAACGREAEVVAEAHDASSAAPAEVQGEEDPKPPGEYTTEPPPALHVIGVYEGALPESADKRPWWAQCRDPGQTAECNARSIRQGEDRSVTVRIADASTPIVLGLMAYEPVTWKIEAAQSVTIKRVVLAGYHSQRIEGVDGVQVDVYTHEPTECDRCVQKGEYFYSYKRVPRQMEEATGLQAQSFQGNYTGRRYVIFDGMK